MFELPRAAAVQRTRLEHAYAGGDRCRCFSGQSRAGRTLSNRTAEGAVDTHARRLLSRRSLRDAAGRHQPLPVDVLSRPEREREGGPGAVPEIVVGNGFGTAQLRTASAEHG